MHPFIERDPERRASRMREMVQRLDVDCGALVRTNGGEAVMQARERCLRCPCVAECLVWLDGEAAGDGTPEFCSNLALFERCKAGREEGAPACDWVGTKSA